MMGKVMAEQCYDGVKVFFAVWDGYEVTYRDEIEDGVIIKPIMGQEVTKRAILLPTKAEEYGTDEDLDKDILEFIHKWLDIPDDVMKFALWNIKRSWVFDKFHTLNYLRALGDTGMGKTRFLDTLGHLHYKAIETSGATTPAPIFRVIEKWKGTLVMDEADFAKSDESQDIIKIINLGYEKGKFIMRCDTNDANKIDYFDPYCPKVLATRKMFTDKAVESRCITQVMTSTLRKDIPFNLNDDFFDESQVLRNKLLMWRFKNYHKIEPKKDIDLGLPDIEPRVKQIVSSFISLFNDDKQLEIFKRFIIKHQEDLIDERQNTFVGQVLGAIHELMEQDKKNITATDIIEQGDLTDYDGNKLKPRGLSSTMKTLGFEKMHPRRVDGVTKKVLILPENIEDILKRYGYHVTKITIVTETSDFSNMNEKVEEGGHSNDGNDGNTVTPVTDIITSETGRFRKVLNRVYQRCDNCGDTPVKGLQYENVVDDKLWCDACSNIF